MLFYRMQTKLWSLYSPKTKKKNKKQKQKTKKKNKTSYDLFSMQVGRLRSIAVVIINFFLWFLIKVALSLRFLEQSLIK